MILFLSSADNERCGGVGGVSNFRRWRLLQRFSKLVLQNIYPLTSYTMAKILLGSKIILFLSAVDKYFKLERCGKCRGHLLNETWLGRRY